MSVNQGLRQSALSQKGDGAEPTWPEPKWLETKWLQPKWLRSDDDDDDDDDVFFLGLSPNEVWHGSFWTALGPQPDRFSGKFRCPGTVKKGKPTPPIEGDTRHKIDKSISKPPAETGCNPGGRHKNPQDVTLGPLPRKILLKLKEN